jgi:hypothetical protein
MIEEVGGVRHIPAAVPLEKTRCPLYSGWAQGRSGRVRKIWSPPEFDPRTVHPVASSYIVCAILAHKHKMHT